MENSVFFYRRLLAVLIPAYLVLLGVQVYQFLQGSIRYNAVFVVTVALLVTIVFVVVPRAGLDGDEK